jgi:copper transport protein
MLAAVPSAALGHAEFLSASPAPGERVQSPPAEIVVVFTEPLNRRLSSARLFDARRGQRIAARVSLPRPNRMLLRPMRRLRAGAYIVRWHTVSILDGHALEGSFGFGVRTPALGHLQKLEESPLARDGWLRIGLRALWYGALFFFAGGLLCAVVLDSRSRPGLWLLGGAGARALPAGERSDAALRRIWARTQTAGWLAVIAGSGVVAAETEDAAGSLSWHAIDAYLLSTVAGGARAAAVICVAGAALLARRAWRIGAVAILLALGAIAVGGHANSAAPRALALLSDWAHLAAGVLWVGGISQIATVWLPRLPRLSLAERDRVVAQVLERFGRVALPAAATVVAAGALNALIELGRLSALWSTGYGRVLGVKIALVGALLTASYLHAFRLRPRIIGTGRDCATPDRRHWRVLGTQPIVAGVVLGAAALLAAFPLPARELLETTPAPPMSTPAGLRPPTRHELSVAEEAGAWIAAAWVTPALSHATGTVRLFDDQIRAVPAHIAVRAGRARGCGIGCTTFSVPAGQRALRLNVRLGRRTAVATIPIAWVPSGTGEAQRILRASIAAVGRLRSWQINEQLSTGLGGGPARSHYRIAGRDQYEVAYRSAGFGETIAIGPRVWVLEPDRSWQESVGRPIDARELMPWWTHRTAVRLLGIETGHGHPVADIGLADLHHPAREIPFWFRLRVDLRTMLPLSMRMITAAHFMDQRYYGFNLPARIHPPRATR